MSTNPTSNKTSQVNKTYSKNSIKNKPKKSNFDSITNEKLTLDLLSKNLSPNEIANTIKNISKIKTYSKKIIKKLSKYSDRIKVLNYKFDKIACKKVTLLDIDETFKGRKINVLVVVDSITGYIISLVWIKNRKKDTIIKALLPYKDLFKNIKLVLTDGAPYFPEVVNELFPIAQHQTCLVHVLRGLFKNFEPFKREFQLSQEITKKYRKKIRVLKISSKKREYKLKKLKHNMKYNLDKRYKIHRDLGIKPYQKNILKNHPELIDLNKKINLYSSSIRSIAKTLKNSKIKLIDFKIKLLSSTKNKDLLWGSLMKDYRAFHKFYNLFRFKGKKYQSLRIRLINLLTKKGHSEFMEEIYRILIKTKGLDTVNKDNCPVKLDRNFINTNTIESTNARLRPMLDKLKIIGDTTYIRNVFGLIKFRLNTTPPYSGLRNMTAPIERYGYNLKGKTFIDLIFEGLPLGPQYGLNSSQIDLELANPNMVGKCVIPYNSKLG